MRMLHAAMLLTSVDAFTIGRSIPRRSQSMISMRVAPDVTSTVYFDLSIETSDFKKDVGRVTFGLFGNIVPKTVENFRCLCTGEKGIGESGKPLHYKGCQLHKIITAFAIQGGDITNLDGTGDGESIYGPTFENENFDLGHTELGMLSMAHRGPDTNGSQFFITLQEAPFLDGKHVVFGQCIKGLDVLNAIGNYGSRDLSGTPSAKVVIEDCGQLI